MREWDELAIKVIGASVERWVPAEIFDEVMMDLKNYRAGKRN